MRTTQEQNRFENCPTCNDIVYDRELKTVSACCKCYNTETEDERIKRETLKEAYLEEEHATAEAYLEALGRKNSGFSKARGGL